MMLRWQNRCEFAARWWASYGDGETANGLMQKLDANNVDYVWTEKADPRFLDAASISRRGAVLWWKTSHCCFFTGWVKGKDGKTYASIIDNNRPGVWEYTEREQFIRGWAGFGGFALTVLHPPATAIPWLSYEVED